ncbi:MAG: hypothetical protein KGO94_10665 [Alphaproteobacteria bacterium]|nr:hypothetical protein [Alphaproteobacteria bacterium]
MAKTTDPAVIFGIRQPDKPFCWLRAGRLKVQVVGSNLGGIFYDGVEVLRGISFLVRDENWGTCPAHVTSLETKRSRDGFTVTFQAVAQKGAAKIVTKGEISARSDQLRFHAVAKPNQDFKTNRTGFVVLHPINGVAGRPVTVTHTDGKVEKARFPACISPGQPFFEIRALEHAPAPGLKAKVVMEGHKYEMEDQRNWTDASFKTYVCSLLDPWPYVLKGGETVEQSVTVTLTGSAKTKAAQAVPELVVSRPLKLPEIGIAVAPDHAVAATRLCDEISTLGPSHLVGTLQAGPALNDLCKAYARIAARTHLPFTLELVLPCLDVAHMEVGAFAAAMAQAGLVATRIVVTQCHDLKSFQPSDGRPAGPSYQEMAQAARAHFPAAQIGGGMTSYFTELNRKQPPQGVFDFITHSICPIVHDASDAAVMQTLECLPHVFASAKIMIGKAPYHLGPSSIGARLNPYGASLAANPKTLRMCLAPNDPRQKGEFAVAWNLGVLAAAAQAGLKSVTLSAINGPQGLVFGRSEKTPLYSFLQNIMELAGQKISLLTCDSQLRGLVDEDGRGYVFNPLPTPQTISQSRRKYRLQGFETRKFRISSV